MNKWRVFLLGVGCFSSFITLRKSEFYPYFYPQEALTQAWESLGNDIKTAMIAQQTKEREQIESTHVEEEKSEGAHAG